MAEGCGRGSPVDFARFVQIAIGSASEVEYLIFLSAGLKYLNEDQAQGIIKDIDEIRRMLIGLMQKLRTSSIKH